MCVAGNVKAAGAIVTVEATNSTGVFTVCASVVAVTVAVPVAAPDVSVVSATPAQVQDQGSIVPRSVEKLTSVASGTPA